MTPDALAPTRTSLEQRDRSPFRVWVSMCWFNGEQVYRWACPKCGKTRCALELDERYCEIAARRLSQGVLEFPA
jgi:hypothetical protein